MGERMQKAPVYFTIVQARFNALLALESYMPQIQENFRNSGFPDFQKNMIQTFNLTPGVAAMPGNLQQVPFEQVEKYLFLNIDRTAGFTMDRGMLAYQSTDYDVFDSFLSTFIMGLKIVNDITRLSYVDRLGFRYLDAVYPHDGEQLAQYLDPCVLGLTGKLTGNLSHSFMETVTNSPDANVISRVVIQSGRLGIAPDLQPMILRVSNRFQHIDGLHAILDTDGAIETRERFDLQSIEDRLKVIKSRIGESFKAMTTDFARKAWA